MDQPVTYKDMFSFAIDYDYSFLAHSIFWAVSEKLIRFDDIYQSKNTVEEYDIPKIKEQVQKNLLGIGKIKIFVIETGKHNIYAFYLAEDVLQASRLHREKFGEYNGKITRSDRLMIKSMTFIDAKKNEESYISIAEKRKSIVQFPAYIGHAVAGENVLEWMGA